MIEILFYILMTAIVLGLGAVISSRQVPVEDGLRRLRLHPLVPWACVALLGFFLFILTTWDFPNQTFGEQVSFAALLVVVSIAVLMSFIEEIRYGPQGIFTRSLFRGRRSFDWEDIVDLKDSSDGLGKKVVTSKGAFVVSDFMPGSRDFLAEVETIAERKKLYDEPSGILETEPIETDPGGHNVVHHLYQDFFDEQTVVDALNQKFFDLSDRCPTRVHEIVLVLAAIHSGRNLYDIPMDQALSGCTETGRDLGPGDDCDENVLGSIRMDFDDSLTLLYPRVDWYEILCPDYDREPPEAETRILNRLAEKALHAVPRDEL